MNETTKTGVFWGVAVVTLGIAALVAWPVSTKSQRTTRVGQPLFEEFKDPLVASSLKIVTFDELQGQLDTFEVRKDRQSGVWTIPSRNGYPADAVEHMRDAANSLVGLKILDIQTENAEDHDDLGVVEPKLEELEVGDEGVGRLVTFKDNDQKTVASLIIGNTLENEQGKIYVRIPGQDPVYVVKLDESPLTTKFQDWIEDDLLQLSSIDIDQMEIKDYNAAINVGGAVSLNRNYAATVKLDGSQWKLGQLLEYDAKNPLAEPQQVQVAADQELNATKLNEMKNALDDLKIVNVIRKPEGMSANLRADKDLLSNDEAITSLMSRGFIPVTTGAQDEIEVLSANGELTVGLKDGVEYVLRFGNVSGVSDEEDEDMADGEAEETSTLGGANRYLLVTTRVNEAHFPPPDLQSVPQTLEELQAMEAAANADATTPTQVSEPAVMPVDPVVEKEPVKEKAAAEDAGGEQAKDTEPMKKSEEKPAAESGDAPAETTNKPESDNPESAQKPADESNSKEKQVVEEKPAEKVEADADVKAEPAANEKPEDSAGAEPKDEDSSAVVASNGVVLVATQDDDEEVVSLDAPEQAKEKTETDAQPAESVPADATDKPAEGDRPVASDKAATDAKPVEMKDAPAKSDATEELTEEEKQERLEAEQEKITKENQRKIDVRKDQIEAAQRRVRDLNARFSDWYYVIAEDTYRKLRVNRVELFAKEAAANDADAASPTLPPFNSIPGLPGN